MPDEMAADLLKEGQVLFLQLNSSEVAAQLTLRDFQFFHEIEATEYIDDLFELDSKFGTPHLQRFSEVCIKCLNMKTYFPPLGTIHNFLHWTLAMGKNIMDVTC